MFNNLIDKLNKVLNFSQKFQSEKVAGSDQLVEYSELVKGADVFVSGSQGSEPAPDGNYKLESGVEFEVKEGKISEIKETAPEEVVPEELATEDEDKPTEEAPAADNKEAELQAKIDELEAEIAKLKGDFSAIPTKADLAKFHTDFGLVKAEIMKELNEKFEKLEKIPASFSQDKRIEVTDANAKYIALAERFSKK